MAIITIQSYVSRASLKQEFWDLYKSQKYFSIDEAEIMANIVDWSNFYFRGMIEIEIDGVKILDESNADLLPETWSDIEALLCITIEKGSCFFTARDQGFQLGTKMHSNRVVEFINYGGIGRDGITKIPPVHVFVAPQELFPALIQGSINFFSVAARYRSSYEKSLRSSCKVEAFVNSWLNGKADSSLLS